MKKKILATIAAIAVAATMCAGFTACGEDEEGKVGDGSVKTEEEWAAAFERSLTAESYKVDVVADYLFNDMEDGDSYEERDLISILYDGVNFACEMGYEMFVNDEAVGEEIEYKDVSGNVYNDYQCVDGNWQKRYYNCDDMEVTAQELFASRNNYIANEGLYDRHATYRGTGDKADVTGQFADLFSLFVYDAETDTYSADLIKMDIEESEIKITIAFRDGYVYQITSEYAEIIEYAPYFMVTYFTDYGEVVVSVPVAVKNTTDVEAGW